MGGEHIGDRGLVGSFRKPIEDLADHGLQRASEAFDAP